MVHFSEPIDPSSLGPGSVRVVRRRGNLEQPIHFEVKGDRVLLHPPSPFGFDGNASFWLVIEGFPSLRAPRTREGRPLARRFRRSFTTSRLYGPDLVPPYPEAVELEQEPGGAFSVRIDLSEPVDPSTVALGLTLKVLSLDDGAPVTGRVIHDRRAEVLTFLPSVATLPHGIRVILTPGILDLAGNPLRVEGMEETVFQLTVPPFSSSLGEIVEDFETTRMRDASGTTARWNESGAPGALCGEPGSTTLMLAEDPEVQETHLAAGGEDLLIRMLIRREELGPPRRLTSLLWAPAGTGLVASDHRGLSVRLIPTRRERLDDRGTDGLPVVALDQATWRIEPGRPDLLAVPFSRWFAYDGETNLILEIRVGRGSHTNFFRAQPSRPGRSIVRRGGKAEPLRPVLGFKSIAMEPTATSLFFDTGSDAPEYFEPLLHPSAMPRGVTMEVRFQGAAGLPSVGRLSGEPFAVSEWLEDVTLLSGYRYLRFRVVFRGRSLTDEEPVLDDLVIPFRR